MTPEYTSSHCIIHHQAVVMKKKVPHTLKTMFDKILKIVNFVKSGSFNSRFFIMLCDEMGSNYSILHAQ